MVSADVNAVDSQNHGTIELSKQARIGHIAQYLQAEAAVVRTGGALDCKMTAVK